MYVLDTNVASELMRPNPAASVAAWVAQHATHDLFLTSVSEAELHYGIAILPAGRRKLSLEASLIRLLKEGYDQRILPFDSQSATCYGEVASSRRAAGLPISEFDCQIASITRSHNAVLVTRNVSDFYETGIEIVNPWSPG